jgi:hypothetical protein
VMRKLKTIILMGVILTQMLIVTARAQPGLPSRVITVDATQPLNFGTFCLSNSGSNGGTITVNYDGSRTSTGDVVLLSGPETPAPAIFEVNLCPGRDIAINYTSTIVLNGDQGGTMTMDVGPTEKGANGAVFQVTQDCNFITQLRVGGTLTLGPNTSNPAGVYTDNFSITFIQQ